MNVRRCCAGLVATAALVLLPTAAAAQGPPEATPAGTGGGCQANGQAVSSAARGEGPFGQFVRTQDPIADDIAGFFQLYC